MTHAPFVALYGFIPTLYQVSGTVAVPLVIALSGVVMVIFAVAHAGIVGRAPVGGGLHSIVAAGLGHRVGLGAAALALSSYLSFFSALLTFFGGTVRSTVSAIFGVDLSLAFSTVIVTCLVAGTTLLRLRHLIALLGALGVVQLVAVIWLDTKALTHPATGNVSFVSIDPPSLLTGSFALAMCLGLTVFFGTEVGLAYRSETRAPGRTIAWSTGIAYLIVTVVLSVSVWALSVALGPEDIVAIAQGSYQSATGTSGQPQPLVVEVVRRVVDPSQVRTVTNLLTIVLSLGALAVGATIAAAISRHLAALARVGVLPASLAGSDATAGPPAQTAVIAPILCGVVSLVVNSRASWLTAIQGMIGGLGIVLLLMLTSLAIIVWLLRHDEQESGFLGWEIPVVAAALVAVVTSFIYVYSLFRTPDALAQGGDAARWLFPICTVGAVALGVGWSLRVGGTSSGRSRRQVDGPAAVLHPHRR